MHLIVGVCSDEDTRKFKGKCVLDEKERAESLRHCRWVDQVVEKCPWVITQEFLDEHDIDFVAHDAAPYEDASGSAEDSNDVYAFVKKQGKFIATDRTPGISTSDIITRIVKDYEVFVKRNLSRGVPREELNVSFLKEKQILLNAKMKNVGDKINEKVDAFVDNSKSVIADFLRMFDRNIGRHFHSNGNSNRSNSA